MKSRKWPWIYPAEWRRSQKSRFPYWMWRSSGVQFVEAQLNSIDRFSQLANLQSHYTESMQERLSATRTMVGDIKFHRREHTTRVPNTDCRRRRTRRRLYIFFEWPTFPYRLIGLHRIECRTPYLVRFVKNMNAFTFLLEPFRNTSGSVSSRSDTSDISISYEQTVEWPDWNSNAWKMKKLCRRYPPTSLIHNNNHNQVKVSISMTPFATGDICCVRIPPCEQNAIEVSQVYSGAHILFSAHYSAICWKRDKSSWERQNRSYCGIFNVIIFNWFPSDNSLLFYENACDENGS